MNLDIAAVADNLYSCSQGTGPAVMCLHSSTGTHAQWRTLTDRLAPHWHVTSLDLHGHGRSPAWPDGAPSALDVDASAVMAVARASNAWRESRGLHLVAHSYGGAVALQCALRYPQWVRSLTLYEPVAFGVLHRMSPDDTGLAEIRAVAQSVAACVARGELDLAARRFIDYWSDVPAWLAMPPHQQATVRSRMGTVVQHFEALFGAAWGPQTLGRLTMPVLLLQGSQTRAPARRVVELLGAALPHARRVHVHGAGHLGPITHAAAVVDLVAAQLEALRTAPAREAYRVAA